MQVSSEQYKQSLMSACKVGATLFKVDYCAFLFFDLDESEWHLAAEYPPVPESGYLIPIKNLSRLEDFKDIQQDVLYFSYRQASSWSVFDLLTQNKNITSLATFPLKTGKEFGGLTVLGNIEKKDEISDLNKQKCLEFNELVSSLRNLYRVDSNAGVKYTVKQRLHLEGRENILNRVIEQAVNLIGAKSGGILEYDPKHQQLIVVADYGGLEQDILRKVLQLNKGRLDEFLKSNTKYRIIDNQDRPRGKTSQIGYANLGAILEVKLELGNEIFGILYVEDELERKFTHNDGMSLHFYGGYAAILLAGGVDTENEKRVFRRFETFASATREIVSDFWEIPLKRRLELITQHAAQILNAEACSILLKKNPEELKVEAYYGYPADTPLFNEEFRIIAGRKTGLTGHIAAIGKPYKGCGDDELANHPAAKGSKSLTPFGHCYSMIMLPLMEENTGFGEGNIIGWLRVDNKLENGKPGPEICFTAEDEAVLELFTGTVVSTINSATQFDELDRLLAHSPNSIVFSDTEGNIKYINRKAEEIFGYSNEELRGQSASKLYYDEEEIYRMGERLRDSAENRITDIKTFIRNKTDERIPINLTLANLYSPNGARLGTVGYFEDLRPLIWRETFIQTLIDKNPDYIYVKDTDSKFIIANMETAKRMGVENPRALIGKTDFDFYPEHLAKKYYADEQEIFTSGEELVNREEEVIDLRTNQWGWISTTKVPVIDENGKVVGLVGIGRDMTAIREENKKIRSLYNAVDNFIKSDDPDDILELAVKRTREAANAEWCSVILVDINGYAIALEDDPHDELFTIAKIRSEKGFTRQIVKEGRYVSIEDTVKEPRINPVTLEQGYRAVLGLPLIVRNNRIGAIWLHYNETRSFSNNFVRDMQDYANYVAIAFDRVQRITELDKLRQASRTAIRATALQDITETLNVIVNGIQEVLNCDIVTLYIGNTYANRLNYTPTYSGNVYKPEKIIAVEKTSDESFVYQMLKHDDLLLVPDISKDERFWPSKRRFVRDEAIKSCAVIPLIVRRELLPDAKKIGIIFVNFRSPHSFTEIEENILHLFASQAAIAIDNAQMYERAKWRMDTLKILYETFTSSASVEADTIFRAIPEQALKILGYKANVVGCVSYIFLLKRSELQFLSSSHPGPLDEIIQELGTIDIESNSNLGITGLVAKSGKSYKSDNIRLENNYISIIETTKSQLSVPILSEDDVLGVITIEHPQYEAFNDEDQQNIEYLAAQATLASEKVALSRKTKMQAVHLIQTRETAHKIARLATSASERSDELLFRIGELIRGIVGCDLVSIYNESPSTGHIEIFRVGPLFNESKRRVSGTRKIFDLFSEIDKPYFVEERDSDSFFANREFSVKEGVKSTVVCPLRVKKDNFGFILLNYRHIHHFESDELDNIGFIIDQVAIAMHSILLLTAEKRQKQELDAVYKTAVNILSQDDFQKRLDVIVEACKELLNAKGAKLYLLSPDKKFLELRSVSGSEIGEFLDGFAINKGIAGYIIREGLPYYIENDYASSQYKIEDLEPYFDSLIEVPLLIDRKPIGVLGAFADDPKRIFNEQVDLPILERLAKQAALAIHDSQMLEQSNKLRDLVKMLSEALEPQQVADAILDGLHELVIYDSATIQLIDEDERELFAARGIDWENLSERLTRPISQDYLIRKILSSRKIRVIPNTPNHPHWDKEDAPSVLSWIGIPLWAGNKPIALITIDHSQRDFYKDVDVELLELFAGHAAIAINNALLFRDLEKKNEQLTETQYQLEQTQSLAMIGLFYGEDIHLTSNKLGAARAHAKYIREHPSNRDKIVNKALRISDNIDEILELIDFIQEAIQPPDLQQIDLYDLLQEAISAVPMSRLIHHKWPCDRIDGTVFGLRRQLRQVFRVIIFNAVKAMPEGRGTISYCLKNVKHDDVDYVLVSIADTGVGIPERVQPYVFKIGNPDEDRDKAKSFSFGLAWVNLFLHSYGGDICFETRPVVSGTTLYVLIPRELTRKNSP